MSAEYTMDVDLLRPPRAPYVYACSRFDSFCPKDHYHPGPFEKVISIEGEISAAPARIPPGLGGSIGGSGLTAVLTLLVAGRFLGLGRWWGGAGR